MRYCRADLGPYGSSLNTYSSQFHIELKRYTRPCILSVFLTVRFSFDDLTSLNCSSTVIPSDFGSFVMLKINDTLDIFFSFPEK